MPELDPLTRAILQLARWGLERERKEAGTADKLASTAAAPTGDDSEENVLSSVAERVDTASDGEMLATSAVDADLDQPSILDSSND